MSKSRILLAGVALFVTLICWSLSSPINAHRDERFHIASIWCSNRDANTCSFLGEDGSSGKVYLIRSNLCVPRDIEHTYKRLLVRTDVDRCRHDYSPNDSLSSSNVTSNPNFFYESTDSFASNISISKAKIYYRFMSNFITKDMERSILGMRIFNSIMFSFLVCTVLLICSNRIKIIYVAGFMVVGIAYSFALITSINTSSWAIIGCSTGWPLLWELLDSHEMSLAKKVTAYSYVIFSACLAVVSRTEGFIFVGIIYAFTLGVSFLKKNKRKEFRILLLTITIGILALIAREFLRITQGLMVLDQGLTYLNSIRKQIFEPLNFFLDSGATIKRTILIIPRILGLENPHWQPPGPPKIAFWSNSILSMCLLCAAIKYRSQIQVRFILSFVFIIFATVAIYSFTSSQTSNFYYVRTNIFGDEMHSRYLFPLVQYLFIANIILSDLKIIEISKKNLYSCFVIIFGFVNSICLYDNGMIFREHPEWFWFNPPINIDLIVLIGSVSFVIFLCCVFDLREKISE